MIVSHKHDTIASLIESLNNGPENYVLADDGDISIIILSMVLPLSVTHGMTLVCHFQPVMQLYRVCVRLSYNNHDYCMIVSHKHDTIASLVESDRLRSYRE